MAMLNYRRVITRKYLSEVDGIFVHSATAFRYLHW